MEKDIEDAGGSYLKRQPLVEKNQNITRIDNVNLNQSKFSNI